MIRKFAFALALTPMLAIAQSPATQTSVARLEAATTAPTHTPTVTHRITTGVIAPKIIKTVKIECSPSELAGWQNVNNQVDVALVVGEDGKAHDVRLLRSINQTIDERVLNAVKQYEFKPASLDNENISINMTLHVRFERSASID